MPSNKRAAIRYRLIDRALQRRHKVWTFQDLLAYINEQLTEYYHAGSGIRKRTLEADFHVMRADPPLGFSAPILYRNGEVRYEDPDFSIEKMPLSTEDIHQLNDAVEVLRQFPELDIHGAVDQILSKVRQRMIPQVSPSQKAPFIYFEKNPLLKGLDLLPDLYQYTKNNVPLRLTYCPYEMEAVTFIFHPYLLKEYNNRWFVIGYQAAQQTIWNLSLDRIEKMMPAGLPFYPNSFFNPENYFDHIVGVTLPQDGQLTEIVLEVENSLAPYLLTKPIHPSQLVSANLGSETIFTLKLIPNYEFFASLLSYLPRIKVLQPDSVKEQIKAVLKDAIKKYEG